MPRGVFTPEVDDVVRLRRSRPDWYSSKVRLENSDHSPRRSAPDLAPDSVEAAADLKLYLDGEAIYGDDFGPSQIADWFEAEKEGYADLGSKDRGSYKYGYHALNRIHGYRALPKDSRFRHALGFGSAYGDELLPIIERTERVTIVDPSDHFAGSQLAGRPVEWVKPHPTGTLPFSDRAFDLITCFGVLHHVPNVSHVLNEFYRVLIPGGLVLVEEPIVSMGDWRRPRPGLTTHERGLPLGPLRDSIARSGLTTRALHLTGFGPLVWLVRKLGWRTAYNSELFTWGDWLLAESARRNYSYHSYRNTIRERLRPTSMFAILERPRSGDASP